jgi:ADP-ribose pyrophosphatase YjhB (NUDIX family)
MSEFAVPVVGALIFNSKSELFLMQSSGKFGSEWIVPGGKVNFGETMENALRREIKEETNIELGKIQFLGVREMITEKKHFIFLEFARWRQNDEAVILNSEAVSYKWCQPDDLRKIQIAGPTQSLIEERLDYSGGTFRLI